MFTHHLKLVFRNLRKHKAQSLVGIFGLAFGLACFVPALYWLRYETSYDSFYPDAEHIYRIYSVEKYSGNVNEWVPGILERRLHEHFPAMEAFASIISDHDNYSADGTPHIHLQTLFADSSFFSVFPQTFLSGDAKHPLQIDLNMILTESVAVRLFGDVENAIGQPVRTRTLPPTFAPYIVTAVIKDPPPNTNLSFDVIIFWDLLHNSFTHESETVQWTYFDRQLYVKINSRANVKTLAEQLLDFTTRIDANHNIELRMLPISEVRHSINTDLPFTLNFMRLFAAAGILLMLSALFNFMSFHLDLFRQRIREFRQRAVHGATSGQLIVQMMFEMACIIVLALAFACCLIVIVRPVFAGLLDIEIELSQLIYLFAVCGIWLMALMLLISIVPFWRFIALLAIEKPIKQFVLRRAAVILQLSVSIIFIVAALVVMMQMQYVNRKNLGFDSSVIIQLHGSHLTMTIHGRTLMSELAAIPQIESITATHFEPQHNPHHYLMVTDVEWAGKSPFENPVFYTVGVDSRFAETFRLIISAGAWWDEGYEQKIVLNEEAVRVMGLNEPIGAIIRMPSGYFSDFLDDTLPEFEVVGVVNNFHSMSLRSRIHPAIFRQMPGGNTLYIRVVPDQKQYVMRRITAIIPDIDVSLADVRLMPLDEVYDRLNYSEQAGLKMFSVMATICMLIALFGIFAVSVTSTQRRRKEIAIRKVFGAEVSDIIGMFFREYTLQVIIAAVVALPLAYLAMNHWLQGYAYRTNIPSWLLIGVVIAVIAVVLLTVLGQVLRAANRNPAEVVKGE